MSRYRTLTSALAALYATVGGGHSRHRKARVHRFIYRHPRAHRSIISNLQKADRRQVRRRAKRRHQQQLAWSEAARRERAHR